MRAGAAVSRFRRELLPPASVFWKRELAPRQLSRPSRGWARTTCPLHGGDNPTAFVVNLHSGAFYCHACGVKGGDIVAFVQQRDKLDFKTAATALGAWDKTRDGIADARHEIVVRQRQRERVERAADRLAHLERELRLEYRNRIHECDQVLLMPGPWSQAQWQRAQAASVLQEHLLTAYTLLSFGALAERARYVLCPESRDEMTATLRLAGGLRDDQTRWVEVLS